MDQIKPLEQGIKELKEDLQASGTDCLEGGASESSLLAILMTYEQPKSLSALLGEPASDLTVLCDVNFSNKHALSIYQNIGTPHFIFSREIQTQITTMIGTHGSIFQNAPDTELFSFAKDNHYDAILSCDKALYNDKDLCVIAKNDFNKHSEAALFPSVPVVIMPPESPAKSEASSLQSFIEENGREIAERIHNGGVPYINVAGITMHDHSDGNSGGAGSWLKKYMASQNEPG